MAKKIVIIGAGPTGLGAAYRLHEEGHDNWQIFEKNHYIGGLSASFKDEHGFTWDVGGHVMFSHYKYFDELVDKLLADEYLEHLRESWIWIMERFVPYPFQNNIRYLPREKVWECVQGLMEAQYNQAETHDFKEWLYKTFGNGIADIFMLPQNKKTWAHPPEKMNKEWIAERVSIIDLKRILKNIILARDDISWGPNNRFKFPLYGGTGGLFNKFMPYIEHNLQLQKELSRIDIEKKRLKFTDGTETAYDILINTAPLDIFINRLIPTQEALSAAAARLEHNSGFIVGIGIKKACPSNKCWMYFPQADSPFYRVTYFSNYSPNNVPEGDYYSLMCETSFSEYKQVDKNTIIEDTIQGLINSKLISERDREHIVSTHPIQVEYLYPIPSLKRDRALGVIQPYLMQHNIYSRGRFGAWLYEIGNMDHSVMQGVELVDYLLSGKPEATWQTI